MNFKKSLVSLVLLGILGINSNINASILTSPIASQSSSINASGRLSFYDENNNGKFAKQGDWIKLYRGPVLMGFSDSIDESISHYENLSLWSGFYDSLVNNPDIYIKQAFNSETNTLWNLKLMGYNLNDHSLHFQGYENTGITPDIIPEPSSIGLLGLGSLALSLKKNKK